MLEVAGREASADLLQRRPTEAQRTQPLEQSFSRSYGSILPTSLIYIVLSTRGCSPWRPAAVMSTTRGEDCSFPWIFKCCGGRPGPGRGAEVHQPSNPSSGQTNFRLVGC